MPADLRIFAKRSHRSPLRLAHLLATFACLTVVITVILQLTLVHHFAVRHASEEAGLRLEQLSWQMRDSLDRTLEQATREPVRPPTVEWGVPIARRSYDDKVRFEFTIGQFF